MKPRQHPARVVLCTLITGLLAVPLARAADEPPPQKDAASEGEQPGGVAALEEPAPVVRGPIPIEAPPIDSLPGAGQGRLSIAFEGNRRWCTFPDDRLQESPAPAPDGPKRRRGVFTFGYQFSIAAVDLSRPGTTLLLFSSPLIRTASLRQAGKLGRGQTPGRARQGNPAVVSGDDDTGRQPQQRETPATLVPYWDEAQRCATIGKQFDFDLEPGRYDVHLSFDIMIPSGAWVHRTYAYLTGVEVVAGSRTVIDGLIEMRGGGRRDVELRSASVEALPLQGAARH